MIDADLVLAFAGMIAVTYGARLGGLWLGGLIPTHGRWRAALDALTPAMLISLIVPTALATGVAETVATLVVAVAVVAWKAPNLALLLGVVAVAGLRAVG
ncbi:hypothetical protein D3874_03805 [Oleomonas cavernae]|uniref:AzlD domain-containing protein n=1 Tax=Oleomonas cavernae TaxID=2320859 RepID=A0A418W8E6_9PROT|nr:AzlD domain-containing protein [Oleomonas cavernae]RJF86266.1 hypothetical protein D3874_03805 [Oleomonas cavernae]